ncbi:MAG: Crp/Fnr family transcriptional regulator [Caldilineaceae bacterium]|nr:Crp/Fnr family transcriptional regulator [Caldilineaceae bacterium]
MPRPDQSELVEHLQAIPIFASLGPATLRALVETAHWREYTTGAVVFLEEEPAQGLYYLHRGWLKIVKFSADGREQILQFLGPGEIFNYLGVFASTANPATAITLEAAGVWLLPRPDVRRVLIASPDALLLVVENMAQRIATLVQMIADLSLHSVEARLARRLLENAEGAVVYRRRWSTQAEMAAHLGTVPDVLNRALRSLAESGLIQVERQQITILDREGLADKALLAG